VSEILVAPRVVTGDGVLTDAALVLADRTIAWVGPVPELPDRFAGATRVDYPGATILPGLIDAHVHLGFDGGPNPVARMRRESDAEQLMLMARSARDLLGVGVTTARDLGARGYLAVAVRDAVAADLVPGPRLLVAASPITVTGGHCWYMGGEADGAADLRRLVRTHHKHGADLIKVMSTGGFMTEGSAPWYAQFGADELAVVVDEAARVDKHVAAHVHGLQGTRRAVEAGVHTLEHCSFVTESNDREFDEELAARIAERGIYVCPTINVNLQYICELTGVPLAQFVRPLHERGVRLIAGTDAGIDNVPHHQYVAGLQSLAALGFTPEQVIEQATTTAAEALGLGAVTGRLAAGYAADLLVVAGDPTADLAALHDLQRVVARGRDYVPPSGRFDVAAPGSPYTNGTVEIDQRLLIAATKRR
jgi:imidazolonepropionase-like amidohydrolase